MQCGVNSIGDNQSLSSKKPLKWSQYVSLLCELIYRISSAHTGNGLFTTALSAFILARASCKFDVVIDHRS